LQRCSAGPPAAAAIQQPCILQQQQRFLSAQGSPPHPRLPCTHSGISAPCSLCAAGADALSRYVDWRDRGTCILFGDGCGALVLTARDDGSCGLLGIDMHSDGNGMRHLNCAFAGEGLKALSNGHASDQGAFRNVHMNGQEVFKFAVRAVPTVIEAALDDAGLAKDQVDWLVMHQANMRIMSAAADRLGVPPGEPAGCAASEGG
jgi:3-oxoacyl-[acyl-carrier-protein] synthase-3